MFTADTEAMAGGGVAVHQPQNTRGGDWVGTELEELRWPKPLLRKATGILAL